MIEKFVQKYLNTVLDEEAYNERPAKRSGVFVVVEKGGSGEKNHINSANMIIQSYAESLVEAAELNEKVKAAMKQMNTLPEICKVTLNSDYPYTDTATKSYRYQAIFDITHY